MLSIREFTLYHPYHHQRRPLLDNLNIEIAPAEIVTLMGPSGIGKSTLLNWMIGDLATEFQTQGSLWLNGSRRDLLATEQRRIGILFQDDLLFPHLNVEQNLMLSLPARITGRKARQQYVEDCLREAELPGISARDPATLSGGQRARVSLLRALLAEPEALLLDEPFSRLDVALRQRFREFVYAQVALKSIPVLLVTHDPQDLPPNGRLIML